MKHYKTKCIRAHSILGEKPPQLDPNAEYIIVAQSLYFDHCVIIQRLDCNTYQGERRWIVPESSMY